MGKTEISWTSYTWNCARGCQRVSPGCGGGAVKGPDGEQGGCYAEAMAARIVRMGGYEWIAATERWEVDPKKKQNAAARASADRYRDLVKLNKAGKARWTGKFALDTGLLADPLSWRSPRLVFVNSMSDLFGEGLSNHQIAAVFGVMAACPQSTFQVLTKRAARMAEWFRWMDGERKGALERLAEAMGGMWANASDGHVEQAMEAARLQGLDLARIVPEKLPRWPLPNVWLGVSCERQEEADERIPHLLACPAEVRWVSAEPLLGPIDFHLERIAPFKDVDASLRQTPRLNWVVFGGESGHGARPCAIEWIRSGVAQCRDAEVAAYVKQLGAYPLGAPSCASCEGERFDGDECERCGDVVEIVDGSRVLHLQDKKGADMAEWPEDLRVRQWPAGFTPPKSKALPVVEDANA